MIGFILGCYRVNGRENGSHYSIIGFILGLYRENGKEKGNHYSIIALGYSTILSGLKKTSDKAHTAAFGLGSIIRGPVTKCYGILPTCIRGSLRNGSLEDSACPRTTL